MVDAPGVEPRSDIVYSAVAVASLLLLLLTGLTAGLATGFLGLDPTHLEVLRRSGSEAQRRIAQRLQSLLSRHNLVLFSIVLLHAIADEALPLVLERAFNEYIAVALSVPLVLLFGEVLPAAVFSSKSGGDGSTVMTARLAPLMWACVAIAGVITLPLSWAVERCVCCRACGGGSGGGGAAGARGSGHRSGHAHGLRAYRRHELAAFLQIHAGAGEGAGEGGGGGGGSPEGWRRSSSWSARGSDGGEGGSEGDEDEEGGGRRSSAGSAAAGRASGGFRVPLLASYEPPPVLPALPPGSLLSAANLLRSSPLPRPASAVTSPGVSSGRLWTPLAASHASAVGLELQLQSPATDTREPPSVLVQGAVADAVFSPLEATPPFRPHESTAAAPAAPPGTPQGGPERPTSTLVALAPPGAMPAVAAAVSPARRSDAPDPSPSDSVIANVASVGVLTASGVATEESSSAQVSGTEGSASATSSQNEGAAGGSLVGHGAETAVVPGTAGSPERAFPAQRGGTAHLAHVGTRENLLSRISSPALQFWRSAAPWRRVTPRLPPPPLGLNADLQSEAEAGSQSERASSDDGGAGDIPQAAAGVPSGLRRPVAEHLHAAASAVSTPAASMASAAPPGSVGGADASPSTAGAVASSASGGASRSTSDAAGTASSARTDDRATGNVSDSTASGSPAHAPVGHHHPRHHHGRSHGGAHHHHHHEERGGSLTRSELSLLEGTLGLMSCSVASRMVPLDRVFALAETAPVDADLLRRVADTAHSRLPVLAGDGSDRHAIVGLLLVKALLRLPDVLLQQRPHEAAAPASAEGTALAEPGGPSSAQAPPQVAPQLLVGDLPLLPPCALHPRTTMLDALRTFQSEHCHMAVVTHHVDAARMALSRGADDTGGETLSMRRLPLGLQILGVITLEDCILAVLNDDYHSRPSHPPPLPGLAPAVQEGAAEPGVSEHAAHTGTGSHHHGHVPLHLPPHRGAPPPRSGHAGASARPGERVGSVMSDANDMQRVARIMAHRQHRHLQPL